MIEDDAGLIDDKAYPIGLGINPDREEPEWYTLWFYGADDKSHVAVSDGRIQWRPSVEAALAIPGQCWAPATTLHPELDSVCDVGATLHELSAPSAGQEGTVLHCLDLLDDMVLSLDHPLPDDPRRRLNRLAISLFEGTPLPDAVAAQGGTDVLVEAVLASLGRILALSDFDCR